jgi:hypothetical protein
MKNIFKSVINQGGYDLPDMLRKIDQYHVAGKLTDQERDELYTLARGGADPSGNLDLLAKVLELEDRVKKLEDAQAEQPEQPEPEQAPADYVAGKWYRTGDRVTFEGAEYTCTAPEGQVCTWSPAEYPAYWQAEA